MFLVLKASILLTVFAIGLSTRPQDLTYVVRRPGLVVRSLLSIDVVMPLFAASLAAAARLLPVVEIILIALSVSPIPPLLPKKARNATGESFYAIGLLVAVAFLGSFSCQSRWTSLDGPSARRQRSRPKRSR